MSLHFSAILPHSSRFQFAARLLFAVLVWFAGPQTQAQVLLSISDTQVVEGNSGTNHLAFTLSLSEPAIGVVTVEFSAFGFSATDIVDFIPTNGSASFNPGETNQSVFVAVRGDALNEPDEIVWLNLANVLGALLIDNRGDGTILNDDPLPELALAGPTVTEGNADNANAIFTVSLSAPSGQDVTAQYTTIAGTAASGADFQSQASFFVLPAGSTNTTIILPVFGDMLDENNEQFSIALTNSVNATLPGAPAPATIIDDDPLPFLNIGDLALLEGTGGITPAAFPVTLSVPSGRALTVDFQTINGVAVGGSDFAATNGNLTFLPGVTNLALVVQVTADSSVEGTESFSLRLINPVNVSLVRTQALATILDDETRTLSFTNSAVITAALSGHAEPYPTQIEISGLVGNVVKVGATLAGVTHSFPDDFDILLVGPLGQTVMLMSDCGGESAINSLTLAFDDSAASELADSGTISSGTFRPSDYITTDVLVGPAPGGPYGSALSAFNGLNPNGTWSLFAYDDSAGGSGVLNGGWRLSITMSNLVCCTGGTSDLSVTVTDSPDPVTATSNVTYTARIINNGPAGATGTIFTNLLPSGVNLISATTTHGTLTTNATQISGTLGTLGVGVQATITFVVRPTTFGGKTNVLLAQSDKVDPDLSNNTAVTPNTVSQLAPLLRIADASMAEGDWGTSNLLFAVSLSRTNATTVTASFATAAGTATANNDYLTSADVITFASGVTNVLVAIPVLGDISIEPGETLTVQITGVTNALLADGSGLGTILNDDGLPQKVQSFTWSQLGATQYAGVPIAVTVTARDIGNNVATAFTGPAKLTAITGSGPDVSVVITEIDTGENDSVEIANVAGSPIDVSGWQVTFYDWFRWPAPAASFVVPPGTLCGANEAFTVTDNGTPPAGYPDFSLGENLFWTNDDSTNMVAVLLRDADGRVIDFVCAVDAYPNEISSPIFIPSSQWPATPIPANTNAALTYRRTGGSDTHQAGNFATGTPNLGAMNTELTLPFSGTRPLLTSPTLMASFVNGVWTGNVIVWQTAGSAMLRASDVPGHTGVSAAFAVLQPADLAVGVASSAAAIATGQAVTFTLRATNLGPITASAVFLTNTLPPNFSFNSASTSQGSFTTAGSLLTFSLGTLSPGATATATVQATPNVGGSYTNLLRIGANTPEGITANNTAQVSVSVNSPPTIVPLGTQFVTEGSTISVTNIATDSDVPANTLTFSLVSAPSGANLTAGGIFTWTPSSSQIGTNLVTLKVADNGIPPLSATQSFQVIVTALSTQGLRIAGIARDPGQVHVQFSGPAGYTYVVESRPLAGGTWSKQGEVIAPPINQLVLAREPASGQQKFYRIRNLTLPYQPPAIAAHFVSNGFFNLTFTAQAGRSYAVETRSNLGAGTWTSLTNVTLAAVNLPLSFASPGVAPREFRVTRYGLPAPLQRIDRIEKSGANVNLHLTLAPGLPTVVETSGNPAASAWSSLTNLPAFTNQTQVKVTDLLAAGPKFYRLNFTVPSAPVTITAQTSSAPAMRIWFDAASNKTYGVEYRHAAATGTWQTLTNVPAYVTNSSRVISDPVASQPQRYYRLRTP